MYVMVSVDSRKLRGEARVAARKYLGEWGLHVRSSPESDPELLKELMGFVPRWDVFGGNVPELVEFHDVVQWLRASPHPPPDLIDRWVGYLTKSREKYRGGELGERWQSHLAEEAYFHGRCDEGVLRCWKECLNEYTSVCWGSVEEEGDESSGDDLVSSGEDDNHDE
ncbi:hypothetical protein B0H19DRAFT_1080103 [Mycena capillaripes]|nr:hypothetical protein B0H19DRAFT_1080103 [Mycena capillaripes]